MQTAVPDHNSRHQHGSRFSCPRCRARMIRVRRRAIDNVVSVVIPVHRFRCSSPECGYACNFHVTKSAIPLRGASRPNLGSLLVMLLGALVLVKIFQAMSDQGLPKQRPGPVIAKSLGNLAESNTADQQEVCQNAFPSASLSANALECLPVDALVDTMSASTAPGSGLAHGSENEWGVEPIGVDKDPRLGFAAEAGTGANAALRGDSGNAARPPNDAMPATGGAGGLNMGTSTEGQPSAAVVPAPAAPSP